MAETEKMGFAQLRDLKLGKLHTAVTDWKAMVEKLRDLYDGSGKGAAAKGTPDTTAQDFLAAVLGADWAGQNATATGEFAHKTARQFRELRREAEDVHGLLKTAHSAFTDHQSDLEKIVDDVAKDNIYINDKGLGVASVPPPAVAGDAEIEPPTEAQIRAAEKRIERVLWDAGETDRIVSEELRYIANRKYDFSGTGADSVKNADARQGEAAADYWAKKLKDGDVKVWELPDDQLERFNTALENQRDNPAFTTHFATRMGGEGTLQFWRDLVDPGHGDTPEGERATLLDHIQGNLSMTLGNATRQDTPGMRAWETEVINAGTKQFGHEGLMTKPYGFQIMSSLMGKGRFDRGFLDRYGDEMYKFERSKSDAPSAWGLVGMGTDLDPGDKSTGADPMTGYLKALSHNPDASTEFFNDPEKADYFLKDMDHGGRTWFDEERPDSMGPDDGVKLPSREALGDALFAAGSGMNPDDPTATYVEHTAEHDGVFDNALEGLAGQKDEMPAELRDDMAKLIGNHGDDAHMTMGGSPREQVLDRADLLEVSKQISRDPDSYRVLNESMNAAMVQDIHTEKEDPEDSLNRSGRTVGFLEEARYQAIGDKKADDLRSAGWSPYGTGGYIFTATAASFLPYGSGHVANAAFGLSKYLVQDENDRIEAGATDDNKDVSAYQKNRLMGLQHEWSSTNSEYAENTPGFSEDHGAWNKIDGAANDGKSNAREEWGDQ
ncbi:hypothetical protein [Streptomyces sp. WMMB303]|uniref:hypothetical protein n=1 Tax=Streptomyces sp. WMMB303 TaxID=3034154 RepID=UPI0023EAF49F|nr:hypothetical protein [Streptomyces sp. WMMB303]MDF4250338.1 hypothetical protein [Streptomyces sp. WMMB303]